VRATKSAMWLGDIDAAERWLAHEALDAVKGSKQMEDVLAHVSATCAAVSAPIGNLKALRAVATGSDKDAPPLLRDCVVQQKGYMFATGHDSPRSMLHGELLP
jgi:hypothetical protein